MEQNSENLVRITSKIVRIQRKSEIPEKKLNSGIKKKKRKFSPRRNEEKLNSEN